MRQLLSISLFLLTSVEAHAQFRCLNPGKIRSIYKNEKIVEEKSFCINHNQYKIISYGCVVKRGSCQAKEIYKGTRDLRVRSQFGSPGHNKCTHLRGKPLMIEYHDGTQWVETSICTFPDSSFISVFNTL